MIIETVIFKSARTNKALILFASFFFAIFAFLFITQNAHATGGGVIDVIIEDQVPSPPKTGIGTNTPDSPQPPNRDEGFESEMPGTPYEVPCSDWNGSGSWQPSASCNTNPGAVEASTPGPLHWGTQFNGRGQVPTYNFNVSGAQSCAPAGVKSAYAQNWLKTTTQFKTTTHTTVWSKTGGWVPLILNPVITGENVYMWFQGCVAPETRHFSTTCFWGYGGQAWYSIDRNRSASAWEAFGPNGGVRQPQAGDPRVPTGGSGSADLSCDRVGSANVKNALPVDKLGYYSILAKYKYQSYSNIKYIAAGVEVYSDWTAWGVRDGSAKTWWTYSCQPGSSNSAKGPYNSQSTMPNVDANLNPATCPQVNWQCKVGTPTIAGLDKNAVANGTVSPNSPVSVLRNGEPVPLSFATIKVVDTSTPSDIDVTNGGTSPGVRNVTSIKYINLVKPGSTPFAGKNPNDAQQYFKLYKKTGSTSLEKFDTWSNDANNNVDKPISFYWASDSDTASFAVQRQWRVTAEFLVPQGGAIGGSSSPSDVGSTWKVGTYDCKDYSGRGASRVDRGILTATSNPIAVVRSAGN